MGGSAGTQAAGGTPPHPHHRLLHPHLPLWRHWQRFSKTEPFLSFS
jgi:hypothetical protein